MDKRKQQLRRSQFVTMYGPGAIIEGPNGSRLIPSLEGLGKRNCNDGFFEKYKIQDIRMTRMLNEDTKGNSHLLSIPSNAGVEEDNRVIYSTIIFPRWHVCYKRNPAILYEDDINENQCKAFDVEKCVDCEKGNNPNVRFVRACPEGHLDDIDWKLEVHDGNDESCDFKDYYYWQVTGPSLGEIIITCPKCGSSTNMNVIYSQNRKCSARHPEKEKLFFEGVTSSYPERKWDCSSQTAVIQKQSSSLRMPVTKTLLKIPQFDESIMDSLTNKWLFSTIDFAIKYGAEFTKQQFLDDAIKELPNADYVKLENYLKDKEIEDLLDNVYKVKDRSSDYCSAVDEEFNSLRGARKESANFSKTDFIDYTLNGLNFEFPIQVCAITKLTTVTAQLSYQRKPYVKKDKVTGDLIDEYGMVPVGYLDEKTGKTWYPAFKGIGEGIFITSDINPLKHIDGLEGTVNKWISCEISVNEEREEVTNPLFIWWHTLSHAIIKSLSLSCGYVSASLHERVYIDEVTGKGGILIYNTSPGEDSGMGGLVDVVFNEKEFNKVLNTALHSLYVCSNDPLCYSTKLENGGVNGAACHNCLLISETSCEHQNSLLDRHFFI